MATGEFAVALRYFEQAVRLALQSQGFAKLSQELAKICKRR